MFAPPKALGATRSRPTSVFVPGGAGFSALPDRSARRGAEPEAAGGRGSSRQGRRPLTPKRSRRRRPDDGSLRLLAATPPPASPVHLQRGALHLSAAEKLDSEVSNVFRMIAQQLRGHRTLFGHVMSSPRDVFQLIDKDGSESLDYREFKEALRRMDIGLTQQQVREVIAAVDADANGTVELGEFVAQLEAQGYRSPRAAAAAAAESYSDKLAALDDELLAATAGLPLEPLSRATSWATQQTATPQPEAPPTPVTPLSPWRVALAEEAQAAADAEEMSVAAGKVQALWRGILTRRAIEEGNWEALPVEWLHAELALGDAVLATHPETPPDLVTVSASGGWGAIPTICAACPGPDTAAFPCLASSAEDRRKHIDLARTQLTAHYGNVTDAALLIQRQFRGHRSRVATEELREARKELGAAMTVQRCFRGHRSRTATGELVAASLVQRHYRGHRARASTLVLRAQTGRATSR